MQPLVINLTGKKVVIAGGGRIAARKAKVLDEELANIHFIAPDFSEEVSRLSIERGYHLVQRKAVATDFLEAFLVILATNDRQSNQDLAASLPSHQLVCVVDESGEGNVSFPATVRRGHLQVAVTSNGASPKLTRKLKKELEVQFDDSWTEYTEFLNQCRRRIKLLPISNHEKSELLWELLDSRYFEDIEARKLKYIELQ